MLPEKCWGGGPGTQLTSLRCSDKCPRASAFSSEPRGSQLPPSRRSVPESHWRWVLAGVRDEGKVVVGERGGGSWTMRGPFGRRGIASCGSRIVKL